jgi:hypothetical protein
MGLVNVATYGCTRTSAECIACSVLPAKKASGELGPRGNRSIGCEPGIARGASSECRPCSARQAGDTGLRTGAGSGGARSGVPEAPVKAEGAETESDGDVCGSGAASVGTTLSGCDDHWSIISSSGALCRERACTEDVASNEDEGEGGIGGLLSSQDAPC